MNRIDSIGTYLGTITEAALGETKNGFPQAILWLTATKKYIDDTEGMKHFGMTEPAYVDWSEFSEEAVAYLVLFKSTEKFDESTKLLNYDQLKTAVGWNGVDFDNFEEFVGKDILFRIKENEYNGKVTLQVAWIDKVDADPVGSLRPLDAEKVKGLSAKLRFGMGATAKPQPAKRVAGKPSPSTSPPVADATSATTAAESEDTTATTTAPAPTVPSRRGRKPKAENKLTKNAAWADVETAATGKVDNDKLAETWLSSCEKVGGDRDEEAFTEEDWFLVNKSVKEALSL